MSDMTKPADLAEAVDRVRGHAEQHHRQSLDARSTVVSAAHSRLGSDLDALLARLSHLEAEIRERTEWARGWHSAVEAILTVAGLSSALGAAEAVEAMRTHLQSAEALLRSQDEEIGRIREACRPFVDAATVLRGFSGAHPWVDLHVRNVGTLEKPIGLEAWFALSAALAGVGSGGAGQGDAP